MILPAVLSIQAIAASQQGSRIDVLLTNRPGLATSFAPGLPGVLFKPGWGGLTIGPIAVSPGGNWTLIGWVDLPSGQDEIVLANGVLVAQSSDLTPWTGGIEVLWFPNSAPAINDAGDVAFSATTNGNGSNLANEYIATRVGGVWAYAARERDPIPYLPGALFGAELDSPVLLADGTAGYIARETLGSVPESQDDVVAIGQTLLVQQGVTAPAGQLGGALRPIATVQERRFGVSPDGSRWFVLANLEGDPGSDEVLVVDGAVALQEGAPAPGTASTSGEGDRVDDIDDVHLDGAGRWYARATVSPGTRAIAVREGEVLARHRQRVTPGSAVRWKLSADQGGQLFGCTGNALGDHVVTGTTDEADPSRDAVAVLNGRTVLLREGDPFDHDGNGAFDDDAYIRQFEVGYGRLDDLGVYRALLWIRSGAGADLGKALVEIPTRGVGASFCAAEPNSTGEPASIRAHGSAELTDADLVLECSALPAGSAAFFLASRTRGFVAMPGGSQGNLCLGGAIGRFVGPGQVQGADALGQVALRVDVTRHPTPSGFVAVVPGETWSYTCWYRDAVGGAATSNFSDGVEVAYR
ncbi:MAG: hypothetical protein AAF957_27030 [Planctomycetota bacterium]